ncbi:di-trans,poly-cis-decaprenylcistransferase [Candidatus Bathyarchaeota archaeon]|nr:di-trans,poly-cis-decaprenylcistransferase [Candidatus Bathyarchaeota archaeon]
MLRGLLSALGVYKLYGAWLRSQIDPERLPKHVGVILDGNRRWASAHDMIPWEGHREGAEKVKDFLQWALDLGITTVTFYAFSTENFSRSEEEVGELMKLYEENLREILNSDIIHKYRVKIAAIGRMNLLPETIQRLISEVEESTKDYSDYYLNVALAYGGRAEIVDATREIAVKVRNGELEPEMIDEATIEEHLYTSHLPQQEPDIVMRTSGESRISNFLIWQSAYSELFFVDIYWPDFREIDLERAIRAYQDRKRRYGK